MNAVLVWLHTPHWFLWGFCAGSVVAHLNKMAADYVRERNWQ